ncbi:MAG TPA: methyltransferase domain-containing protein [Prolixibacteraceae bacterium]|nr:methyltransferase domain-containing protein [Prolixibacteraceae bacterium]
MFENFPKVRNELPLEFQKIYSEHYKKNREGQTSASSLAQKMEAWLHRKVAKDVNGLSNKSTLEIGAGTLNQLMYEQTAPYDIIEPFVELYANSKFLNRVHKVYKDIDEVDEANKYDRITAIATFEHITDLPKVVAKTCIHINDGGTLRVSIPNEGTFLWKLGYSLTTGIEFRMKYKLDYSILMNYEHVNTAKEIEQVLNYFYGQVKCSCFGINKSIALYRFYECSKPNRQAAEEYLKAMAKS